MKHYIIILMPELATQKVIEDLRIQHTGTPLIDKLPPHLTLKTRFYLEDSVTEDDLKKILNDVDMDRVSINLDDGVMFGDAFVLKGESGYIREKHHEIRKALADIAIDVRPEFEGDNFKMHLTLWRGVGAGMDIEQWKGTMRFDRICLYEIDPTLARAFANQIACKELSS